MHKWKAYSLLGIVFDISNSHLTVEDGNALILPSCFPAQLPKTSSHVLFTSRARCCMLPHPPGYLNFQGLSSQSHKPDRRDGLCGQQVDGWHTTAFSELGQPRSPSTTSLILLRQTWPGYYISGTPQYLPSLCHRLAATRLFASQPPLSALLAGTCHYHHPIWRLPGAGCICNVVTGDEWCHRRSIAKWIWMIKGEEHLY